MKFFVSSLYNLLLYSQFVLPSYICVKFSHTLTHLLIVFLLFLWHHLHPLYKCKRKHLLTRMTRTATPVILLLTTSAFIGLEGSSLPHPPAHQGILPPWVKPTTGAILKGDTRLAISDNCFTAQLVEPFMKLMAGLFICSYIPMFVIVFKNVSSIYKSCFTAGHLKMPPRPLARMSTA